MQNPLERHHLQRQGRPPRSFLSQAEIILQTGSGSGTLIFQFLIFFSVALLLEANKLKGPHLSGGKSLLD